MRGQYALRMPAGNLVEFVEYSEREGQGLVRAHRRAQEIDAVHGGPVQVFDQDGNECFRADSREDVDAFLARFGKQRLDTFTWCGQEFGRVIVNNGIRHILLNFTPEPVSAHEYINRGI